MYRVGVIGDKDSVLGFTAIGFEAFPVENPEQAKLQAALRFYRFRFCEPRLCR